MSDAFARFGLKHLSPSSLNLWTANPGLWGLKYLGGMRDDAGPAAWRGRGVETGICQWLLKRDREAAVIAALQEFDTLALGQADDDILDERNLIEPMIETGVAHLADSPPLLATQLRVELWIDGVAIPIIGYIDALFEDETFKEIKTTTRIPSAPRPDHARQASLYREARKRPGSLLYLSGKRAEEYPIGDNEHAVHMANLRRAALSLQSYLSLCQTPTQAMAGLAINVDDFRFSEAASNFMMEREHDNAASHG